MHTEEYFDIISSTMNKHITTDRAMQHLALLITMHWLRHLIFIRSDYCVKCVIFHGIFRKSSKNTSPVNYPHKWPVTRKMIPFDDVTMACNAMKLRDQLKYCVKGYFIRYVCTDRYYISFYRSNWWVDRYDPDAAWLFGSMISFMP